MARQSRRRAWSSHFDAMRRTGGNQGETVNRFCIFFPTGIARIYTQIHLLLPSPKKQLIGGNRRADELTALRRIRAQPAADSCLRSDMFCGQNTRSTFSNPIRLARSKKQAALSVTANAQQRQIGAAKPCRVCVAERRRFWPHCCALRHAV